MLISQIGYVVLVLNKGNVDHVGNLMNDVKSELQVFEVDKRD